MSKTQEYAKALIKHQSYDNAIRMAGDNVRISEVSLETGAVPFYEEVEISTESTYVDGKEKNRERIKIDDLAKSKRLKKTLAFWREVYGLIKKAGPKKQKTQE